MLKGLTLQNNKTKSVVKQNKSMNGINETVAANVVDNAVETPKRGPGRPTTKVTLKRVVLLDGTPVGKGRPAKDGKSKRTVVYIPVDQTFDVKVHGVGVKYRADRAKLPIKRVDIAKFNKLVKTPEIVPAKSDVTAEAVV